MYINFKLARSKGINVGDIMILQMCKQQKFEDLSENLEIICSKDEKHLQRLIDSGYVSLIKGKVTEPVWKKARITSKGQEVLDVLETPEITEEDLVLFDWAKRVYEKRGKEVGNAKDTKKFIALFRSHSSITGNNLAKLIKAFLDDESCQQYSHKLESVFFKPSNVFQVKFDLENSWLYQFYLKNKAKFDAQFEQK